MDKAVSQAKRFQRPRGVRAGRPPRERSGEVETRILDAARHVFLERGLAGASVDEIAGLARAGKPTIYARYPGKEDLFAAVVARSVITKIEAFQAEVPKKGRIEERLTGIATAVLHWALFGDNIDLMRLAIAEARRFPELASSVHRMARERGSGAVARMLAEATHADELGTMPAFDSDHLALTTRIFLDLVLLPLLMRALYGESSMALRAEIEPHVQSRVAFFLAACRSDQR